MTPLLLLALVGCSDSLITVSDHSERVAFTSAAWLDLKVKSNGQLIANEQMIAVTDTADADAWLGADYVLYMFVDASDNHLENATEEGLGLDSTSGWSTRSQA